ncbi:MAG: GAF domain-containing protein [Mesorhizobium sp.]|uniref:ATP-binding protein n=1 Tax=unclassified Mesorhizobium TaxID=325217 RepID=UPI000FCB9592|nr:MULTISPECIES: ATP-binding protein [unclassified Mesorhizobium]RUV75497.1 GAF domain-containing protein [Mesorhizobium sp. M5C.F.Cr.IN.023.01.1.1]RWF89978.1 MAG: GAF domain-containing protein [Mesorhizobium sp.]RWF91345.1 MAG: GAF domain-containing protein [Mesorhizobium sp.]RWI41974.1 MAG: GAF domain-containing protein [Mesorhizobium sp.]RWI51211.1 MAG: GAF domain-containing protein [Mesorhizobium sp.]
MTFSASWTKPGNITGRLVRGVARLPARVQTKLLIAFLSIVGLLIVLGAVGLQVLSGVNDQTNELIKLQRRIAAYRQVQHDTTTQLYSISTALLLQDNRMLDAALRQLNQFGYDLDRMEFVGETEVLGLVRQEYERLTAGVTHVAELIRSGNTEEARKVQLDEIVPSADRLERLTNQLVNIAEADMVAAIETTEGAYGTSRLIVVSFALGSILLALGLGYIISWSLIEPVKKIETRLRQIAAGDFAQQVEVANRDELGVLAGNVNQTSEQLGRLYKEVQTRTAELGRSVNELEALGEVSKAVNSTLDLDTVLQTIVAKAVQLSDTDAGTIYVFSSSGQRFRLRATYGMSDELIAALSGEPIGLNDPGIGEAARRRTPIQVPDLSKGTPSPALRIVLDAGYRGVLVVPLLRPNKIVGALVVRRRKPGEFERQVVHLMETFAAQSVLAIQNAKLFREAEEKGRELEAASRHKSQFLANMSHELRTPLNSVLGFTELLVDGIYGELPEKAKATVSRVQANGRHLLGLINDVLDLSKIEAGQLTLALEDYSVGQIVRSAVAAVEPLARSKGISLAATVAENLPLGRGDERRLTQVLINLAGNAVKFTEEGAVDILANAVDGHFEIAVRDTGPGIAPENQVLIFEEFQQVDNSSTRQKGGTGLGLAISKRFVEMQGGTISLESAPGSGSTFRITIPINVEERVKAA